MKVNKIKYLGEDKYLPSCIGLTKTLTQVEYHQLQGRRLLTKNKIYILSNGWEVDMYLNDHWIFYIFDDINLNLSILLE